MTDDSTQSLTLVLERDLPASLDSVWRALTEPTLIEQWLMPNDFEPIVDRSFNLVGDWGTVECKVLRAVPGKVLAYTWAAFGLDIIVECTLSQSKTGTLLTVVQSGFKPDQQQFYDGAKGGWQQFLGKLEQVVVSLE